MGDVFAFGVVMMEVVLGGCTFAEASEKDPVYRNLVKACQG